MSHTYFYNIFLSSSFHFSSDDSNNFQFNLLITAFPIVTKYSLFLYCPIFFFSSAKPDLIRRKYLGHTVGAYINRSQPIERHTQCYCETYMYTDKVPQFSGRLMVIEYLIFSSTKIFDTAKIRAALAKIMFIPLIFAHVFFSHKMRRLRRVCRKNS